MDESKSLTLCRQYLDKNLEIFIDRPYGTLHPKHGFIYETNYGYVPGVKAPDGDELDAYYLGSKESLTTATGKCIAIIHRLKDDDDKLVVAAPGFEEMTDEEIAAAVNFQEQWFEHEIIRQ